jgi:hypothetical protein
MSGGKPHGTVVEQFDIEPECDSAGTHGSHPSIINLTLGLYKESLRTAVTPGSAIKSAPIIRKTSMTSAKKRTANNNTFMY